jgi:beta-phosphoglucomutase
VPNPSNTLFGVVFDFDGVLADTEPLHLRAFRAVFARRGWALDDASYYERYLGYGDDDLVRVYGEDHGLRLDAGDRRSLLDEKDLVYRQDIETGTVLYAGAAACVRALAARFSLAIASGSRRVELLHILTSNGLVDAFPVIVSVDDVTRTKPDPEPYLTAAAQLGLAPRVCVAIEDSASGLASARSAGLRTIAVTTSSPASTLAAADRILRRVDEVTVGVIESLIGGAD